MPARPKGGKRAKKKMEKDVNYARELAIREEGEVYGIVMRELGNRMLEIYCLEDHRTRRCHIPRRIKQRLKQKDLTLVSMREFATNDDEADIVFAYSADEIKQLIEADEIPEDWEKIFEEQAKILGVPCSAPDAVKAAADEVQVEESNRKYTEADVNDL